MFKFLLIKHDDIIDLRNDKVIVMYIEVAL